MKKPRYGNGAFLYIVAALMGADELLLLSCPLGGFLQLLQMFLG